MDEGKMRIGTRLLGFRCACEAGKPFLTSMLDRLKEWEGRASRIRMCGAREQEPGEM